MTFSGLSDLHLGNQKVTWKKLVIRMLFGGKACDPQRSHPPFQAFLFELVKDGQYAPHGIG